MAVLVVLSFSGRSMRTSSGNGRTQAGQKSQSRYSNCIARAGRGITVRGIPILLNDLGNKSIKDVSSTVEFWIGAVGSPIGGFVAGHIWKDQVCLPACNDCNYVDVIRKS
jgi:hypothetical protein